MGMVGDFAKTTVGKATLAVVIVGACIFSIYQMKSLFGKSQAAAIGNARIFIDSESMKSYPVDLSNLVGQTFPVYSPISGKNTGYPAELCYWTKDGNVKSDPTPVLLNHFIGKSEPTFCPDCGRLVVSHNPMAVAGRTPPLTQEEYDAKHGIR
jgi:hypothetical protein